MCRVRTTGPLHEPKLFNFKLCLMRRTDHKNGTPSVARRPRLVSLYFIHNTYLTFFHCFLLVSRSYPNNTVVGVTPDDPVKSLKTCFWSSSVDLLRLQRLLANEMGVSCSIQYPVAVYIIRIIHLFDVNLQKDSLGNSFLF